MIKTSLLGRPESQLLKLHFSSTGVRANRNSDLASIVDPI